MLIAIIEDNERLRTNLVDFFEHHNFKTVSANNGETGLALIKNTLPNIVLADIMMPKLDGIKMVKLLKLQKECTHIPIIFLTAKGSFEDRLIGFKTGAIDYISKPFNSIELLLKVQNLLALTAVQKLHTLSKPTDENFQSNDDTFLNNLRSIIALHLGSSALDVETIASELNYSVSAIHKKIKKLTNKSTNQFIREYRLEKAKQMLKDKHATVSEIAFKVGFTSVSYFSKSFKKYFTMNPTQVA
jgi:YesN/AraC family two-component response regulator